MFRVNSNICIKSTLCLTESLVFFKKKTYITIKARVLGKFDTLYFYCDLSISYNINLLVNRAKYLRSLGLILVQWRFF